MKRKSDCSEKLLSQRNWLECCILLSKLCSSYSQMTPDFMKIETKLRCKLLDLCFNQKNHPKIPLAKHELRSLHEELNERHKVGSIIDSQSESYATSLLHQKCVSCIIDSWKQGNRNKENTFEHDIRKYLTLCHGHGNNKEYMEKKIDIFVYLMNYENFDEMDYYTKVFDSLN